VNSYSGIVNSYSGKSVKVFTFKPESVFTLNQNRCSRSARNTVHIRPEYALVTQNTAPVESELTKVGGNLMQLADSHIPIINSIAAGNVDEAAALAKVHVLSNRPAKDAATD